MGNAIEAMMGQPRRKLEISTLPVNEDSIEIAVADPGSGIPQNIAAQLFEPFISTRRNGMGLGLSICRSIVEAHGGKLRFEPDPGGGTIFVFTPPAVLGNGEISAE